MLGTSCYLRSFLVVPLLWWNAVSSNPNAYREIIEREIFYNGEIVSIASLDIIGEDGDERDLETLMVLEPNIVDTAVKCKYSDAVIELLQTFYEINEYGIGASNATRTSDVKSSVKRWLTSSIKHFNGIKPAIVKTIDAIFSDANEFSQLKTSDPSLLKSLLSINLFLYYSINDAPFGYKTAGDNATDDNDFNEFVKDVRKLDTSVVQMIGLVERFRHKRCVVHNPYAYNYKTNGKFNNTTISNANHVKGLLSEPLNNLHALVNDESDDYTNFDSGAYDPKHLLFKIFLDRYSSFFESVRNSMRGTGSDLLSKYDEANRAYSIEAVLDYQNSLVVVVADIFRAQIHSVATKSNGGSSSDLGALEELEGHFEAFVYDVLPNSCSVNVCNEILKSYYSFRRALTISDASEMYAELRREFEPSEGKRPLYGLVRNEFSDRDPELRALTNVLVYSDRSRSFDRVFNLLSYEPHANGGFHVVKKSDHDGAGTFDERLASGMVELQCALFVFRAVIKSDRDGGDVPTSSLHYDDGYDSLDRFSVRFTSAEASDDDDDDDDAWPENQSDAFQEYGPVFANMLRVAVRAYRRFVDVPDVRGILLPLLVHFRHAEKAACDDSEFDFQAMYQISYVTISLIENYLINNGVQPYSYGLSVYSGLMVYDRDDENTSDHYRHLHDYLVGDVKLAPFTDSLNLLNVLYDETTYEKSFENSEASFDFRWNGHGLCGLVIFSSIQMEVIDFNDLINFRWYGVKFFAGKILLDVKNALSLLRGKTRTEASDEINAITVKLNEILGLELPTTLHTFLRDVFEATNKTLNSNSPRFDPETCHKWADLYRNNFQALGFLPFERFPSYPGGIDEVIRHLDIDVQKLVVYLNAPFLGTRSILTSTSLGLSPVNGQKSYSSIRMLYDH